MMEGGFMDRNTPKEMGTLTVPSPLGRRLVKISCTLQFAHALVMKNDTNGTWEGAGKTVRIR